MAITKIRVARGLKANLPTPPNAFDPGRPYFCTDTHELFVGEGLNLPMAQVGSSTGLNFTGAWDTLVSYASDDLVTFSNALYIALNNNTGEQPDLFPADWEIVLNGNAADVDTFVFTQSSPISTWVVPHNLNTSPMVVVENTLKQQVFVETVFDTPDQVTLKFNAPESGKATCHV